MSHARETTVYRDNDGDVTQLSGKTVAVVGYGSLGRPLALNLREATSARIIAGGRADADLQQAATDGLPTFSIAEATAQADVVLFLLPDEVQPAVFEEHVRPHLRDGAAVVFASGYNLAFDPIAVPPMVDVLLFAPRMLGRGIRQFFLDGKGYYSYVWEGGEQAR